MWSARNPYRWSRTDPTEVDVRIEYAFGSSRAVQTLTLAAGSRSWRSDMELDWHEHDRLLKVALPVDIHADVRRRRSSSGTCKGPLMTTRRGTPPVLSMSPTGLCTWASPVLASPW